MHRETLLSVAATLTFSSSGAFAQGGALSGVTMHVLDDLSGVEAVVLQLDANRGVAEQGVDAERAPAAAADADADDAARERASRDEPESEPRAERREREDLHDTDVDERSEGHLEDRDVEQRTVAAPAGP